MLTFLKKHTHTDLAFKLREEAELGLLMAEDALDRAQSTVDYFKARLARLPAPQPPHTPPPAPPRPPRV